MTPIIVSPANTGEFNLVKELLEKMNVKFSTLSGEVDDKNESLDWHRFSITNLSRAYSNDEPDYTPDMIKEPNPEYCSHIEGK